MICIDLVYLDGTQHRMQWYRELPPEIEIPVPHRINNPTAIQPVKPAQVRVFKRSYGAGGTNPKYIEQSDPGISVSNG